MAGPSQRQVTDEVWDDDRVKSFLEMEAYSGNVDFHLLMRAHIDTFTFSHISSLAIRSNIKTNY